MSPTRWLPLALLIAVSAQGVFAQDVEMLGRRFGTRPPAGYFREIERNPEAFRFTRGRAARSRVLERLRTGAAGAAGVGATGGPAMALGPRGEPVSGTFTVPLVLGLFSDSIAAPYTRSAIHTAFFVSNPDGTVTDYYAEVSSDSLTLLGETRDWVVTGVTQSATTQGQSALVCCGIGTFIKDLLSRQTGVDWGLYDNDGPDGDPDSGDDDGYVDALAVMHRTQGAECGGSGSGNRIWSHKWTLSDASGTGPYVSTSTRTGGGFIRIDDYFVQGALACDGSSLNPIGIFVHETGHAFGLPDLYDTRSSSSRHNGAGQWDVMATGTWGCNGNTTERPCHMGAWSKAVLGWVDVVTLPPDTDGTLTLPPVETSGIVYRVDAQDGSGEYFLIENRQRIGYDQGLWAEGLLIWQIDQNAVLARWSSNQVNAANHMGVWLRQADGQDDLGDAFGGNRGDEGDPFPGQSGNTAFHAGSNPSSISYPGGATGLTVLDIAPVNADDVALRVLTRFSRLSVSSAGTSPGATGLFTVDGAPLPAPPANVVMSAPFATRTLVAAAGELIQTGERRPFVQWNDAPAEPRTRVVITPLIDTSYEAAYGATQYQLLVDLAGGVNGVAPGSVVTTPASTDLWFAPATAVQVSAVAQTGFSFLSWTGTGLAGQPNPANVVMDAPVFGGASFQLIYAVADVQIALVATVPQDVQLAVANGTAPVAWSVVSGSLPQGLALSSGGRLTGASLDLGAFPITIQATDALGLVGDATLTLEVGEPPMAIAELASQFLLGGPPLDVVRQSFLDYQGNRSGGYDLGDFRAWVLAHPSLPLSAALAPAVVSRSITLPVQLQPRSESR